MNARKKKSSLPVLTKRELANQISQATGITQLQVAQVLQCTLDGIIDALAQERNVEFREFGVFEVIQRQARVGRNPNKPEDVVTIPSRKVIKFKPGKRMREMFS